MIQGAWWHAYNKLEGITYTHVSEYLYNIEISWGNSLSPSLQLNQLLFPPSSMVHWICIALVPVSISSYSFGTYGKVEGAVP